MGFDPRDESWIENDIAEDPRERNWFAFERENGSQFSDNWEDLVEAFNQKYEDTIIVAQAKNFSKKRMRYLLGSYNSRMSWNPSKLDWKASAVKFEEFHRQCEERMLRWSKGRKGRFPLVRTKKPVVFWPGPFFHQCIEKIPQLFDDDRCKHVKSGIILRVVSYDQQEKYIRLDFTPDVRKLINEAETDDDTPWAKDRADYDFMIMPNEIEDSLEILEPLDNADIDSEVPVFKYPEKQ